MKTGFYTTTALFAALFVASATSAENIPEDPVRRQLKLVPKSARLLTKRHLESWSNSASSSTKSPSAVASTKSPNANANPPRKKQTRPNKKVRLLNRHLASKGDSTSSSTKSPSAVASTKSPNANANPPHKKQTRPNKKVRLLKANTHVF